MPGKMARSAPSTTVRAARRASSRPHLAAVLRKGRKSANIYASLGFIRGIPVSFTLVNSLGGVITRTITVVVAIDDLVLRYSDVPKAPKRGNSVSRNSN
jgi:hypothetical protein